MGMHKPLALAVGAASMVAATFAAVTARAEQVLARATAVQPPAWIERAGARTALRAGTALQAGDRYVTGASARLHIEMEDGSIVKLGEQADFEMPELRIQSAEAQTDGVLRGALRVLKGAFRFTTTALGEGRRRSMDISIGPTITAGIRGTDVWGKSEDSQNLMCLLEGRIEVSSPGSAPVVMDQPLTFYVVPAGAQPNPVSPVPDGKIALWAPQTELRDAPFLTASGRWLVVAGSSNSEEQAGKRAEQIRAKGYPVEVRRFEQGGKPIWRLVFAGLGSRGEASRFARSLQGTLGVADAWVLAPA